MQNKIHYIEKDINIDKNARSEMIRKNITGVPAFFIGDDVVLGLDKERILKLVDHRVAECKTCHQKVRVPINNSNLIVKCPKCKNKIEV